MQETIRRILSNALEPAWLEREIAFTVDMFICLTLAVCPTYGTYLATGYFVLRDALPFGKRMSFGKAIYGLRVESVDEKKDGLWKKIVIRNLVTFIPLVNIYDVYLFLANGERLADRWSKTEVRKMAEQEG